MERLTPDHVERLYVRLQRHGLSPGGVHHVHRTLRAALNERLLKDAGLRESRLHDARHTAATVLLVLRQPTPTVMSLMGWSSESMAARYQHVTDALRSQVASQVGSSSGIRHQETTTRPRS